MYVCVYHDISLGYAFSALFLQYHARGECITPGHYCLVSRPWACPAYQLCRMLQNTQAIPASVALKTTKRREGTCYSSVCVCGGGGQGIYSSRDPYVLILGGYSSQPARTTQAYRHASLSHASFPQYHPHASISILHLVAHRNHLQRKI